MKNDECGLRKWYKTEKFSEFSVVTRRPNPTLSCSNPKISLKIKMNWYFNIISSRKKPRETGSYFKVRDQLDLCWKWSTALTLSKWDRIHSISSDVLFQTSYLVPYIWTLMAISEFRRISAKTISMIKIMPVHISHVLISITYTLKLHL